MLGSLLSVCDLLLCTGENVLTSLSLLLQSSKAGHSLTHTACQVVWWGAKEYSSLVAVTWHRPSMVWTKSWTEFTSGSCWICTIVGSQVLSTGLCRVFILWGSSKGCTADTGSLSHGDNLADWLLAGVLDHLLPLRVDNIWRTICPFFALNVSPLVQGKETSGLGRTWMRSGRRGSC